MLITVSFTPESAKALQTLPGGDGRFDLATKALQAELPSAETEEWRYSPIGDLTLGDYSPQLVSPDRSTEPGSSLDGGASAVVEIENGWVTRIEIAPDAESAGLRIEVQDWSDRSGDLADSNSLDLLHAAYTPGCLVISAAGGAQISGPVLIATNHGGEGIAAFPHMRIEVGDNAELSVVERQTSAEGLGLTVSLVELSVASAGRLNHWTMQAVADEHWHLARNVSSVGDQASLTSGIAAFGGAYARLRTDADLAGRGATGELLAVYFGDKEQIHDFRTFQHHSAKDTQSDLVFKGTLDDKSGSIYTGMVRIHPNGAGSNANQTNRNIKLSDDAWAWSVPNLEIENSDVRCSHASTVSPVDADQRFYLHARGVPPVEADKLITAGFFDEVIQRFPEELRAEISGHVVAKLEKKVALALNGVAAS